MDAKLFGRRSIMTAYVELYNMGGTDLLKRVSLKKAMTMLWRGVAQVMEVDEGYFGGFEKPRSIMLVKYIYAKWQYERKGELTVTRRGILKRDKNVCAYCGGNASTIDHIWPQSRGGKDTWDNLVAACLVCNNIKSDTPLGEARHKDGTKMKLRYEPRIPTFAEVYAWGNRR